MFNCSWSVMPESCFHCLIVAKPRQKSTAITKEQHTQKTFNVSRALFSDVQTLFGAFFVVVICLHDSAISRHPNQKPGLKKGHVKTQLSKTR